MQHHCNYNALIGLALKRCLRRHTSCHLPPDGAGQGFGAVSVFLGKLHARMPATNTAAFTLQISPSLVQPARSSRCSMHAAGHLLGTVLSCTDAPPHSQNRRHRAQSTMTRLGRGHCTPFLSHAMQTAEGPHSTALRGGCVE